MPQIEINGVTYAYREQTVAAEERAPLLLLHGFTGSSDNWAPLMARFGRRTIAVDLLGHGGSEAPNDPARYAMAQAAADLARLTVLLHDGPIHLLGYSMGGRLALFFALTYPERVQSLILESASPGLAGAAERDARRGTDNALAASIEAEGIESFVDGWQKVPLFASQQQLPEAVRRRQRLQRLANNAGGLANSLRGMGTGVQPSLWDRLHELQAPALLLAGGMDEKFCRLNRMMQQRIPTGRLTIVEHAGHTVHLEKPDDFVKIVGQFIQEQSQNEFNLEKP